jgi:hypothetical protein
MDVNNTLGGRELIALDNVYYVVFPANPGICSALKALVALSLLLLIAMSTLSTAVSSPQEPYLASSFASCLSPALRASFQTLAADLVKRAVAAFTM